jgi:tryptophan synthase alpha chain
VVARAGVTGAEQRAAASHGALLQRLAALDAAPCLVGFGIAEPAQVAAAIADGAAGAISGSAVVAHITRHLDDHEATCHALREFTQRMKAATLPQGASPS